MTNSTDTLIDSKQNTTKYHKAEWKSTHTIHCQKAHRDAVWENWADFRHVQDLHMHSLPTWIWFAQISQASLCLCYQLILLFPWHRYRELYMLIEHLLEDCVGRKQSLSSKTNIRNKSWPVVGECYWSVINGICWLWNSSCHNKKYISNHTQA